MIQKMSLPLENVIWMIIGGRLLNYHFKNLKMIWGEIGGMKGD